MVRSLLGRNREVKEIRKQPKRKRHRMTPKMKSKTMMQMKSRMMMMERKIEEQ